MVTNGTEVRPGQYSFLTAVLSGRNVLLNLNADVLSGEYVAGGLHGSFAGELVDCGRAYTTCADAVGKVCAIEVDNALAAGARISPANQILHCSNGGGVGVVFRDSGELTRKPQLEHYAAVPAVYVSEQYAQKTLVKALLSGDQTRIDVREDYADTIMCGGTYLGDVWVLTAAHCVTSINERGSYRVRNPEEILVNVGAHDLIAERESAQPVAQVIVGSYRLSGPWSEHDYALLRLYDPVPDATAVLIADRDTLNAQMASASSALILGWGSPQLREPLTLPAGSFSTSRAPLAGTLALHTVEECNNQWQLFFRDHNLSTAGLKISENHLCASNPEQQQDACQGDSGGPLLIKIEGELRLAGITSFGLGCGATAGVPGVYTNATAFIDWVALQTAKPTGETQVLVQADDSAIAAVNAGSIDLSILLTAIVLILLNAISKQYRLNLSRY